MNLKKEIELFQFSPINFSYQNQKIWLVQFSPNNLWI